MDHFFPFDGLRKIKKKFSKVPHRVSTQDFACLNSDCLIRSKIPVVVRIISYPFCMCYCKCWTSLTAVVQTGECRCHLRQKYKGFKSGDRAVHAVGPPSNIQCFVNTLFKNSRTARRKCFGAPCYMNHKWIIVCRSASCNNCIRTFRSKSWYRAPVSRGGKSMVPKVWFLRCLQDESRQTLWTSSLIIRRQSVTRRPSFRRRTCLQHFCWYCCVDPLFCSFGCAV